MHNLNAYKLGEKKGVVRAMLASSTVVTVLLAISACSGNGTGLDVNGRPIDSNSQQIPLQATFSSIQENVLSTNCALSGCHSGSASPVGLQLDSGFAYDNLVGVASGEQPSIQRVAVGDPDNSYLIQKISGIAAVGARMPIGQSPLPESTIQLIRTWIGEGAIR